MTTSEGVWVLPTSRALWIIGGTNHSLMVKRPAHICILYIQPEINPFQDLQRCRVVEVTPLVRELISTCASQTWDYKPDSPESRLAGVLIDQLRLLNYSPLDLMMPSDERALRIVEILKREPGNRASLKDLAREAGASTRTIERLFVRDTHMSFGAWRLRYRMLYAVERLAYGDSVTRVSLDAGYESSSSFIASFRAMFGITPSRYFSRS